MSFMMRGYSMFLVTFAVLTTFQLVNCAVDQRYVEDPLEYCRINGNTKQGYITVAIKHAIQRKCVDIAFQQWQPDAQVIIWDCIYDNEGSPQWNQRFECRSGNKQNTTRFRVFNEGSSNCIFTGIFTSLVGNRNTPLYTIRCNADVQAQMSWRFLHTSRGSEKRILLQQDANKRCLRPDENNWVIVEVDCNDQDEMQHWVICNPFDRNCP